MSANPCMHVMYTVGPLYYGHFETLILVLITEISVIQRSLNALQYYTGTKNGVLIIEVSVIQRFPLYTFLLHNKYVSLCGVLF